MPHPAFAAMQAAVDIVGSSLHPDNKVAATVFGTGWGGRPYSLSRTNYWPPLILDLLGRKTRIGNASGTIHAETACLLEAEKTQDASLCVTDPFCPNCAKNIAEAGIKTIYIDHKGFDKDFFSRRAGHFETMSMQICEKAGIDVYELNRRDQKLIPIYEADPGYIPFDESPVEITPLPDTRQDALEDAFKRQISQAEAKYSRRKHALAFASDEKGDIFSLSGRSHPSIGLCMKNDEDLRTFERPQGKYSFIQEPVNRLLMIIKRRGLKAVHGYFYCSQVPTAREQVNLVGAGLTRLAIGDTQRSRDASAQEAMQILRDNNILTYG